MLQVEADREASTCGTFLFENKGWKREIKRSIIVLYKREVFIMKVAIPLNEDQKTVCVSFARAPWFLCIEIGSNERTLIDNEAKDAEGGAGIQAAQILVDYEVEALLTPRCGENAGKVLAAADVKIYKSISEDLELELQNYKEGKLEILSAMHPGFHGHGFS